MAANIANIVFAFNPYATASAFVSNLAIIRVCRASGMPQQLCIFLSMYLTLWVVSIWSVITPTTQQLVKAFLTGDANIALQQKHIEKLKTAYYKYGEKISTEIKYLIKHTTNEATFLKATDAIRYSVDIADSTIAGLNLITDEMKRLVDITFFSSFSQEVISLLGATAADVKAIAEQMPKKASLADVTNKVVEESVYERSKELIKEGVKEVGSMLRTGAYNLIKWYNKYNDKLQKSDKENSEVLDFSNFEYKDVTAEQQQVQYLQAETEIVNEMAIVVYGEVSVYQELSKEEEKGVSLTSEINELLEFVNNPTRIVKYSSLLQQYTEKVADLPVKTLEAIENSVRNAPTGEHVFLKEKIINSIQYKDCISALKQASEQLQEETQRTADEFWIDATEHFRTYGDAIPGNIPVYKFRLLQDPVNVERTVETSIRVLDVGALLIIIMILSVLIKGGISKATRIIRGKKTAPRAVREPEVVEQEAIEYQQPELE